MISGAMPGAVPTTTRDQRLGQSPKSPGMMTSRKTTLPCPLGLPDPALNGTNHRIPRLPYGRMLITPHKTGHPKIYTVISLKEILAYPSPRGIPIPQLSYLCPLNPSLTPFRLPRPELNPMTSPPLRRQENQTGSHHPLRYCLHFHVPLNRHHLPVPTPLVPSLLVPSIVIPLPFLLPEVHLAAR